MGRSSKPHKGQSRASRPVVRTSEQNTRNAAAERHDWKIVSVFADAGISGAKAPDHQPGLDALTKTVTRRDVDIRKIATDLTVRVGK
jgi:hypothetical protein